MSLSSFLSFPARQTLLAIGLGALTAAATAGPGNRFCGSAASPTSPDDLANVVGDQTLEFIAQQPASMLTCSKGYLLEKCGDHETANLVFDKCIAAGYPGAMIWKALLLQDGSGVAEDLPRAAALLHQAATSGDPAYGPIGKMHYATVLYQGKGVVRDEAEAMKWFQAAAAEGSEEAQSFLKTGYHTGARDQHGMGAGTPTVQALAAGRWENEASQSGTMPAAAQRSAAAEQHVPPVSRKLENNIPPTPLPPPAPIPPAALTAPESPARDIQGQKLQPVAAPTASLPTTSSATGGLLLLLLASFVTGLLRQARRRSPALISNA